MDIFEDLSLTFLSCITGCLYHTDGHIICHIITLKILTLTKTQTKSAVQLVQLEEIKLSRQLPPIATTDL